MQKLSSICLLYLLFIHAGNMQAQETGIEVNTDWDHERFSWEAQWVTHPTASVLDYGVFLFRNQFSLDQVPESLVMHLSADNRYKLWVNGKMAANGPAKGSFLHWRYESIDLGPWLQAGDNVLAVESRDTADQLRQRIAQTLFVQSTVPANVLQEIDS